MQLRLEMNEQDVFVLFEQNGEKIKKSVDLQDFLRVIQANTASEFPLLPSGTRYLRAEKGIMNVAIERQAHAREVTFAGNDNKSKKLTVPFPTLIFIFSVKGNQLIKADLFSMKHSLLSTSQQLFDFPYSNANPGICWGKSKLPKIKNLMDLEIAVETFLGTSFNNDIGGNFQHFKLQKDITMGDKVILSAGNTIDTTERLFDYLNGKPSFPHEILNLSQTFMSYIKGGTNE